jgi:hypothetical protein
MTRRIATCCFLASVIPAVVLGQPASGSTTETLSLRAAIRLAVDNNRQVQTARLQVGMIGTVFVRPIGEKTVGGSPPLPTVPLTAVVRSKTGAGEYAAFTVERQNGEDVARMRQLQLGDVVGNAIVVVKGLEMSERVIVTGASLLVDGEPVRVIP